jgi:hypothetical protein
MIITSSTEPRKLVSELPHITPEAKIVDRRESGFYIIDNEVMDIYAEYVGPYGIAVYSYLVKCANRFGENAFPAYDTIAQKLNISRPKVISTVAELVDVGMIKVTKRWEGGRPKSNLYEICHLKGADHSLVKQLIEQRDSKRGLPSEVDSKCGLPFDSKRGLPSTAFDSKCGLPKEDPNLFNNTPSKEERDLYIQDLPGSHATAASLSLVEESPKIVSIPEPKAQPAAVIISAVLGKENTTPTPYPAPFPMAGRNAAPSVVAGGTGDLLMDQAAAKFNGAAHRHHIDGITKQVEGLGLTMAGFREMVDAFLGKHGLLDMVSLDTDLATRTLTKAQTVILSLCGIDPRFRSVEGLQSVFDSWKENDYRGKTLPSGDQLVEHAGKMRAGVFDKAAAAPPAQVKKHSVHGKPLTERGLEIMVTHTKKQRADELEYLGKTSIPETDEEIIVWLQQQN